MFVIYRLSEEETRREKIKKFRQPAGKKGMSLPNNWDGLKKFKDSHKELIEMVRVDKKLPRDRFIGKDLLIKTGPIEHDPLKVAKALMDLL